MEEDVGSCLGYAEAKYTCSHAAKSVTLRKLRGLCVNDPCAVCGLKGENFVCLSCGIVLCGRWRSAHMLKHATETGHQIACGFQDLSFWCYGCDGYLNHLTIRPIYDAYCELHKMKFNEPVKQAFNSHESEGEALKEAVQMYQQQKQADAFECGDDSKTMNEEARPSRRLKPNPKVSELELGFLEASMLEMHGRRGKISWAPPRMVVRCDVEARPNYNSKKAHEYQDDPQVLREKVQLLADLIRKSKKCMAYTGAGISTASGIGDYASKAEDSKATDVEKPRTAWEARPTVAHRVLVALHKADYLKQWIQQNHDGLPQKAGCPQHILNEIHGAWYDPSNPVVAMSGELRSDLYKRLLHWEQEADLCLCLGTSVCGMNADRVVSSCASREKHGQSLGSVIVSLQQTALDDSATLRIFSKMDDVMSMLAEALGLQVLADVPYKCVIPARNTKAEDVYLLPFDVGGRLLADRENAEKFLELDLRVGASHRLCSGPFEGDYGEVQGKNSEGHYKICFQHQIKAGSKFRAPMVRVLGLWWIEAAAKGEIAELPCINAASPE